MSVFTFIAADLLAISVMVLGLYFPRHRRRDLIVAFLSINVGVMGVTYAMATADLSLGFGLLVMPSMWFSRPVLLGLGQTPVVSQLAQDYLRIAGWGLIANLVALTLNSYLAALERTQVVMWVTLAGLPLNIALNWVFIFGNLGAPELGLQGAAVATILTTLTTLAAYVVAIRLDPRLHRYRVFGRWWSPDWPRLLHIVRIGTPIALTITAEAGIFGAAAFLMGHIGASQLAAHTVALQIAALAFQVPFGVGQASTIRVGYFYGARDSDGMARAGWAGIGIALLFMSVTSSAMVLVPDYLLAIYIDPWAAANVAMVAFATRYLLVAAAFQLVDGVQAVAGGALRGLQDTRVPMWIAVFSYWVPGFGTAMVLGFATPLAGVGVWLGLATGLAFAAVLLTWRWARREALGLTRVQPDAKRVRPPSA